MPEAARINPTSIQIAHSKTQACMSIRFSHFTNHSTMNTCPRHLRHVLHTMLIGLLLVSEVTAAPPEDQRQVLRFAVEGRADVSKIRLASDRRATVTVTALSQSVAPNTSAAPYKILAQNGRLPANITAVVQSLIVIPHEKRGRLKLRFETSDPAIRQSITQAANFLMGFVSPKWLPRSEIRVQALPVSENRAYATGLGKNASIHLQPGVVNVETAIHELAHHIEGDHRFILELSKRFIARRARGGTPERLRDLTGHDYGADEITLRANWTTRGGSHYVGKFYGSSLKQATATEVISMGLERLYREPDTFFREDSDYFLFLLLALQSG